MGIVETVVTVGGVLAIIGLVATLFCHYMGGWTRVKAWVRSSQEEKMVLTRAGTHRHFNPNGFMISSDSDLNLSGRGSFRRFDTTDTDYQLFRQGSCTSLQRQTQGNIPPQPLRPAPIPPSVIAASQLASQSSLDSVFNTAPPSPAFVVGSVPRIPPPPPSTGSSSSSHASPRITMGDGNSEQGGNNGTSLTGGGGNAGVANLSSTNPFLPLLQVSSQFFSQTIQSFQAGLQQSPNGTGGVMVEAGGSSTSNQNSGEGLNGPGNKNIFQSKSTSLSTGESAMTAQSRSSASSSVSTIPSASTGVSMGELLFSAAPLYRSTDLEPRLQNGSGNVGNTRGVTNPASNMSFSNGGTQSIFTIPTTSSTKAATSTGIFTTAPVPPSETGYLTKHHPNARPIGVRSSSGSPQHVRYNLYHQNSAENLVGPGSNHGGGNGSQPARHSPPPGSGGNTRRASYPNRKEYAPHDTIPKSEFPQHISYTPSPHHHHHAKGVSGVERKVGVVETALGYGDPIRHHHYHPPVAATPVQPFLEEQEEPPDEPGNHYQLPPISNLHLEMEREDLKNRIMLETMREEIRIANERMADATKSLMMDEVFLPLVSTSSETTTTSTPPTLTSSSLTDSPKKRLFSGNLSTSIDESSSKSKDLTGGRVSSGRRLSTSQLPLRGSIFQPSGNKGNSGNTTYVSFFSGPIRPSMKIEPYVNTTTSRETEGKPVVRAELMENKLKNGFGSGAAVSSSSGSFLPGNHTSAFKSASYAQPTELGATSLDFSSAGGIGSLFNARSSISMNATNPVPGCSRDAIPGPSRPPTVGSYFKQNSRSFSFRQSSTDSLGSDISDLSSPNGEISPSLLRAMSCESVCSETSVALADSDPIHVTGHLCIGLEYDRETADLLVNVREAKELQGPDPDPNAPFDSYVRVYLLPDKTTNMQTRVYRKSCSPVYKEKFMFGLEMTELASRTLVFYLYATDKYTNTLIGETELRLGDIDLSQACVIWLVLTDTGQKGGEFGEIMFSLSYLPTAERLTVVVVKARRLKFPHDRDTGDPFVKVYLLQKGKKVSKKKSSTKRGERSPIFNEAMIFSIPAHVLQTIQLRITVADSRDAEGRAYSVGHVIVGSFASGKPLSHWNQMLSSLRKPIAMWHSLKK